MSWSLSPALSQAFLGYYFGPDHRMKMRIWEWAHRLLGRPRFTVSLRAAGEAIHLSVDLRDFIQFEIAKTGGYEPEVWDRLSAFATRDEIVWDIGANIGSFAFRAASHEAVAQVHAFEPNPKVLPLLRKNRKLNPKLSVTLHPIALSSANTRRSFYIGLSANRGVGGFFPRWTSRKTQVDCYRGDDWITIRNAPSPTLIKLDVEGAELEVLEGLKCALLQPSVKAIIFEAHWGPGGSLISQPVVDFLKSMGFETPIPPPGPEGHPINLLARRP